MTGYRYSTEELLISAFDMLGLAAKEQARSRQEDRWPIDNETLKAIRKLSRKSKSNFTNGTDRLCANGE